MLPPRYWEISMRRHALSIALMLCLLLAGAADASQPADLGSRVREIFAAKCSQCHSAGLIRPKGKFGYVLDLARVAANPRLVVPSDATHSKLWQQIADDDMPPDDAKAGPLSDSEKQIVRSWIEAGAPAPPAVVQQAALAEVSPDIAPPSPRHEPSVFRRTVRLAGKLHVLVIHFPIALIAAAAGMESWWILRRRRDTSPVVRFCVYFGAAGAVVAAVLGWLHAPFSGYESSASGTLLLHRWLGVAAATGAMVAAGLSGLDELRGRRSLIFRAALFGTALLIGLTGHLGGTLVYGDDFFRW